MSDIVTSENAVKADPTQTHESSKWKHARPLTACRFDPSGNWVFTGGEDTLVVRWEVATGKPTPLAAHDSWVRAIGFSKDGQSVYTGGYDGRLIWWPLAGDAPQPTRTIDAHQGWLRALVVSPDSSQIATCGNDLLIKLWDAAEGKLIREFAGHESHVYNIAFHPDGQSLVSCDLKANLKQWKIEDGSTMRSLTAAALYKYDTTFRADIGGARSLAFDSEGKFLAVGGITNVSNAFAGIGNAAVVVFDWTTGQPLRQHDPQTKVNGALWGVRFHPDGYWVGLSGGGGGGWLYFWKPESQHEFHKLKLADTGRDMDLSPDATRLAVAHADGHLRIYTMAKKA